MENHTDKDLRPTIKQLLKWNGEALRKLECVQLRSRSYKEDWRLVDSYGNFVDAKLIRGPKCVGVSDEGYGSCSFQKINLREHPSSPLLKRPFYIHNLSPPAAHLTGKEFKLVLGSDYDPAEDTGNTTRINAMWQAIESCPTLAANAYVLGQHYHEQASSKEVIVPVQYYHINPRRHRALRISQYHLDSLLEEIKEERNREDARYNIKSAP